jgi:ParB-like chromosome segregation protein Spo0J
MTITNAQQDLLPFHPLAKNFPLMNGAEFNELVADVKANRGLHEPITLYQNKVLDGRNRYRACLKAKVEPRFEEFEGNDAAALAFVISKNIHRRHLKAKEKREAIAKLLKESPEKSDRAIGRMIKADNKTVASVRAEKEAREEIPHVTTRTDARGRQQPAQKGSAIAEGAKVSVRPRGKTTPQSSNPLLAAWDAAGRETRHAFVQARWIELMRARDQIGSNAVHKIAEAKALSDPGPIPECLRRDRVQP